MGPCRPWTLDLTDPDAVAALVERIVPVGILVHSARTVGLVRPVAELTLDECRRR